MDLQLLPDLAAMVLLIAILLVVRRRHPQRRVDLWLVGLLFILIESVARIFYEPTGVHHKPLHAIALDAYCIAGTVFIWTGYREGKDASERYLYAIWNTVAPLLLFTAYGLEIRSVGLFHGLILAGFLVGAVSSIIATNSGRLLAFQAAMWLPMWIMASREMYRTATYWQLFCIYAFAAFAFRQSLSRKSTGRLAIVGGFILWALSFLIHPFIAPHPVYAQLASEIWNLQKFLITIGMVLVMLEEQILRNQWLASHDELTGLPNRRLFEERLTEAMEQNGPIGRRVALLMIDLNGFKAINDSLGHQAGDELLRQFGINLRARLRVTDTIARLGGDEFTILATGLRKSAHVDRIHAAVADALDTPIVLEGKLINITGSIGIAVFPDDAIDEGQLFRLADRRMYDQKELQRKIMNDETQLVIN